MGIENAIFSHKDGGRSVTACSPEYDAARKISPPELAPKAESPQEG